MSLSGNSLKTSMDWRLAFFVLLGLNIAMVVFRTCYPALFLIPRGPQRPAFQAHVLDKTYELAGSTHFLVWYQTPDGSAAYDEIRYPAWLKVQIGQPWPPINQPEPSVETLNAP